MRNQRIKELSNYKWDDEQYIITKDLIKSFKERVNKIYKEIYKNIKYKSPNDPTPKDVFDYIDGKKNMERNVIFLNRDYCNPYVDHVGQFANENDFYDKIFHDDEFLKRFIFNKDSYITIGGDEYRGYNIKTIGFQYDYKEDYINHGTENNPQYEDVGEFWDKLKEYEKNNDVFLKGN